MLKIPQLQSLRALAATAIFIHHGGLYTWYMDVFGAFAVLLFFCLSGFLMSAHYSERVVAPGFSYRRFISGKLLKLYPLNVCCAVLFFVLLVSEGHIHLYSFVANLTLTQAWLLNPSQALVCNGPAWTLSVTILFYFIFPPLIALAMADRRKFFFIIGAAFLLYLSTIPWLSGRYHESVFYFFPPVRIFDFLLGMVVWLLVPFGIRLRRGQTILEIGAVIVFIGYVASYRFLPPTVKELSGAWIPAIALIAVFAQRESRGFISRVLSLKPLVWLGGLSFSLYLVHRPIQYLLSLCFKGAGIEVPFWLYLIIGYAITVGICAMINPFFVSRLPKMVMSRLFPSRPVAVGK